MLSKGVKPIPGRWRKLSKGDYKKIAVARKRRERRTRVVDLPVNGGAHPFCGAHPFYCDVDLSCRYCDRPREDRIHIVDRPSARVLRERERINLMALGRRHQRAGQKLREAVAELKIQARGRSFTTRKGTVCKVDRLVLLLEDAADSFECGEFRP